MRKKQILGLAIASLALAAATSGRAQPYSNAVVGLNPVAYWPLNETTQPPNPVSLVASNSGTLGAAVDGYYGAWYQASGNTWFITNNIVPTNGVTGDGSQALWCQSAYQTYYPGQYVVVPRNTNGVANPATTITPPFSIEVWAYVGSTNGANRTLVSEGQVPLQVGGPNPSNPYYGGRGQGWAGFALGQYQDYFYFSCYCTNAVNNKSSELDSSGYNKFLGARVGSWVHVVATFDGTTEQIWTNGVLANQKNVGANAAGMRYVPDPTSPLMIGNGNDVSATSGMTPYSGALDEVAIYPVVLSQSQIQAHYAAASTAYASTVLADSPSFYYRFDDGLSQANSGYPTGTFPVANNYGSIGTVGNGVYQPGTTPGVSGPAFAGFGTDSKAVALNGFFGAVDIGGGALPPELNPTNIAPLTVVSWFKGAPADSPGRFQEILGHGDSSYRLAMDQAAGANRFNPGPGPELQFANAADVATNQWALNDGNWHMVAGVSDGTNDFMYLDGILVKSGTWGTNITIAGSTMDLLLGGDSQYTYASGASPNTIRNFDGSIAQVAFWTNALSSAQIAQLYTAAAVPPYLTLQPVPSTNNAGASVTLSGAARGSQPLSYQWYLNGTAVSSATESTLTLNPLTPSQAGSYTLVVNNASGSVTSAVAQVTVYSTPVVVQQSPTAVQVFRGSSPTFFVSALGPSLTYQWSANGTAISGATTSTYTAANIQANASYTCTVGNSYGSTPISPISVTVLTPPAAPFPSAVLADKPLAYYRLDESSGTTAYDYVGGLNATYTNVSLGQSGYSSSDPSETSVAFGPMTNSFAGWVPSYLNFGAPAGTNSAFSIEAWVNGGTTPQLDDAGLVTLGYGNGGEQFNLDLGGSDPKHNYRFFVRNAAGTVVAVNGTNAPTDGNWHHVVAVCDQPNSNIFLYVDGVLEGKNSIGATAGILKSSIPMSIGSRQSGFGSQYDNQLTGNMDDVAIYGYALSSAQVQNHYYAIGVAPMLTVEPTNTTVNFGANAYFYAAATGTAPLAYQWWDISTGTPVAVPSATNSTLVISNVTDADNNRNFYLVVTNSYGEADSYYALLSVLAGPPFITGDIQPLFAMGYAGTPFTYTVTASGSAPFTYVWTRNGTTIAGATASSYSFNSLAGTNAYQVTVQNSAGSAVSSIATNIGFAVSTLTPSDYTYKMKITFAGYNKTEALANFPALVQIGTNLPDFSYSQLASPAGGDLRFTDASGTRELPYEIDEWNPNGVSSIWVQIPSLSSNTNFIWAYWGNPAATTPEAWTTNGEVWAPAFQQSPNFDLVYHLEQNSFPFLDSTLQYPGGPGVLPGSVPGLAGQGCSFSNPQFINASNVNLGDQFTLYAFVNLGTPGANSIQPIWANGGGGYATAGLRFYVNSYSPTPDGGLRLECANGTSGSQVVTGSGAVTAGAWHMLTAAIDRAGGKATLYVDGAAVQSGNVLTDFPNNTTLDLGTLPDGSFHLNGLMDEARIAAGVNSDNWIWATYATVAQNSTFESYSAISSSAVTLTANKSGNNLILTWPQGTLQSAGVVNGTYTNITTATSPYSVPLSGAQQYFRVKVK